jgi:hypothetical protein
MDDQDQDIIIRNSATCLVCHDQIESRHVHDYVTCECGAISVDGGRSYLRRAGDPAHLEDTSIFAPDEPRTYSLEHSQQQIFNVHHSALCTGRPCTIHNRSDHPLRSSPQIYFYGLIVRCCTHLLIHIDPDDPTAAADCLSDCDGCCERSTTSDVVPS